VANNYLPYDVDQRLLLAPDMRAWLPEEHLALFVLDVVSELDQRPWHTGQGLGPRATDSGMGTRTGWGLGSLSFCPTHN